MYCTNCGEPYSRPQKYCRRCGLNISPEYGSFASDSVDVSTRAIAGERSYWHLRRKRRLAAESNDSLQMFVSCVSVIAILHGLSLFAGSAMNGILGSGLLWIPVAGMVIAAITKYIFDMRYGYSPLRSIAEIILFGLLAYGVIIGVFLYFSNMAKSGQPLFNLQPLPTRTPHALVTLLLAAFA